MSDTGNVTETANDVEDTVDGTTTTMTENTHTRAMSKITRGCGNRTNGRFG